MSKTMKWLFGFLIFVVAGWYLAVYIVNHSGQAGSTEMTYAATDSLQAKAPAADSVAIDTVKAGSGMDTVRQRELTLPSGRIDTRNVRPQEVVAYANTLMGVPYLYGSTDPANGFDCSGFITYVFNHFDIVVPRSSIDFTHVGTEISAADARPGDLILFTGTNPKERFVGHMGIVVNNSDSLRFIHSTSGKQYGVTITPLNTYYQERYVKTIRIFPQ